MSFIDIPLQNKKILSIDKDKIIGIEETTTGPRLMRLHLVGGGAIVVSGTREELLKLITKKGVK